MAKLNSGILGAVHGSIHQVTGYRRKGKNIIQHIQNREGITLATGMIANANKFKQLTTQVQRFEKGIKAVLSNFGESNIIRYDELMKQNLDIYTYSNEYRLDRLIFLTTNPRVQPRINFFPVNYPSSITITLINRVEVQSQTGLCTQYRSRYYSHTNVFQLLPGSSSLNLFGSATPPGTVTPGHYYLQAARMVQPSIGYKSVIAISIAMRP